jgi:hypothetical protein
MLHVVVLGAASSRPSSPGLASWARAILLVCCLRLFALVSFFFFIYPL